MAVKHQSWEEAAKEHIGDGFGISTAHKAIEAIAENGNTAHREDVEEVVNKTGADGEFVVDALVEAHIVANDRYHGHEQLEAQANQFIWGDYNETVEKLRERR